ncbi:hypothetical protein COLO4_11802 [Corchorus olitorius]|uniref:ATPase family AAA domain-containing protein n=1 Tax=Corchorus olitorius TaxID=93759 RepID=A0A1R3K360_9ROSI|nr:hypothetical protein COLO4_11802 [Corchorus olitorius]
MAKACAAGLFSALAAASSSSSLLSQTNNNIAFADGPFNFPLFSSSPSPSGSPPAQSQPQPSGAPAADKEASGNARVRNDNPRTSSAGFDPEALERGAKALREISSSPNAKKAFELMKKQEETRQAEMAEKAAEFKAMQAQAETAENEFQRARNQELVKLQEDSAIRQEQARRATEEQIQAQRRQTEREKAEIERETIRVRAMAEAEGRAHEAKLAEDVNRRILVDRANAEREKWVAAINTTFEHIGGGLRAILTDQNKLVVAVGGLTALAAGIYTTR